jgi:hypothetical protein
MVSENFRRYRELPPDIPTFKFEADEIKNRPGAVMNALIGQSLKNYRDMALVVGLQLEGLA